MTRFINSVAQLTELRQRDQLEETLASVMFDLLGPSQLIVWRIVKDQQIRRLRTRIRIEAGNKISVTERAADTDSLPLLSEHPSLCACFETREPSVTKGAEGQPCRHLFPVVIERDVVAIIDIQNNGNLREYQQRVVSGLIHIYCNHLKVLDESELDALTGLLNRKRFNELFHDLIPAAGPDAIGSFRAAERRNAPNTSQHAWLAVIDVDHFKRVNDHYGHAYGDEVLILLARLLKSVVRDYDNIFRFGGEEFVLLLSSTEPQHAPLIMERCRSTVAAYEFPQVGHISVSIGYTKVTQSDAGDHAYDRADEALYMAKARGRNQALCYEKLLGEGALQPKAQKESEIELF